VIASEIAYRAWSDDGKLRHASFKGVREDPDEVEIFQLERLA
jgi:bifunctional non-homologous end joining protein LigD